MGMFNKRELETRAFNAGFGAGRAAEADPHGNFYTGLGGTVLEIDASVKSFNGWSVDEQDSARAYLQIFFKKASDVTLGTTAPDLQFGVAADGGISQELNYNIRVPGNRLSVALTTASAGGTGVTTAAPGQIYYTKD